MSEGVYRAHDPVKRTNSVSLSMKREQRCAGACGRSRLKVGVLLNSLQSRPFVCRKCARELSHNLQDAVRRMKP